MRQAVAEVHVERVAAGEDDAPDGIRVDESEVAGHGRSHRMPYDDGFLDAELGRPVVHEPRLIGQVGGASASGVSHTRQVKRVDDMAFGRQTGSRRREGHRGLGEAGQEDDGRARRSPCLVMDVRIADAHRLPRLRLEALVGRRRRIAQEARDGDGRREARQPSEDPQGQGALPGVSAVRRLGSRTAQPEDGETTYVHTLTALGGAGAVEAAVRTDGGFDGTRTGRHHLRPTKRSWKSTGLRPVRNSTESETMSSSPAAIAV